MGGTVGSRLVAAQRFWEGPGAAGWKWSVMDRIVGTSTGTSGTKVCTEADAVGAGGLLVPHYHCCNQGTCIIVSLLLQSMYLKVQYNPPRLAIHSHKFTILIHCRDLILTQP